MRIGNSQAEELFNDFTVPRYLYNTYWKEAAKRGYVKSLKELKSLDRIVLPVQASNNFETIELLSEEQKESMMDIKELPYEIAIPFISEAVVVYSQKNNIKNWIYYKADYSELDEKRIYMQIEHYTFRNGFYQFCSKFISKIDYGEFADNEIYIGIADDISIFDFAELIPLNELPFSKDEQIEFKTKMDIMNKRINHRLFLFDDEGDKKFKVDVIKCLIKIFTAINIILSLPENQDPDQLKAKENPENLPTAKPDSIQEDSENLPATDSDQLKSVERKKKKNTEKTKIINLGGIEVMRAKKDSKVKMRKGKMINRMTDVWGVRGHVRHYKSGKTVYIKPFQKGPGRKIDGKKKTRKIYKF